MNIHSVDCANATLALKYSAIPGRVDRYRSVDAGCSIDRPAVSSKTVVAVRPAAASRDALGATETPVIGHAGIACRDLRRRAEPRWGGRDCIDLRALSLPFHAAARSSRQLSIDDWRVPHRGMPVSKAARFDAR